MRGLVVPGRFTGLDTLELQIEGWGRKGKGLPLLAHARLADAFLARTPK
jgi:hypothetical protein